MALTILKKINVLTKIIIFSRDKSKVLMLFKKHGYWDLPGGHLEFGESPEECLQREMKEELGTFASIDRLFSIKTIILNCPEKKPPEVRQYVVLTYAGKLSRPARWIELEDSDNIDHRWFRISEIRGNKKIKMLAITKEQLSDVNQRWPTVSHKKYYIKSGSLKPYKVETTRHKKQ